MFGWLWKKKKKEEEKDEPHPEVEEDLPDDQELEKEGFDPEQLQVEPVKDETLTDFSQEYPGYLTISKDEIIQIVQNYQYFQKDEELIRHELGHKKGGRICSDKEVQRKLRGVGKEIIKQIGKKILSGSMNLTKISFPIKAMIPKTAIETSVHATCLFPLFMSRAAISNDPLERLKLLITTCFSSFFWTNTFLKPLNPILGETLQAQFNDGTEVFCEQTSHHPPVSYFLIYGPNKNYRYYGYYNYDAKAGLNSLTILNKGKRYVEFPDGQKIYFDFPNEIYTGTFVGTLKQESVGKMNFIDLKNGYRAEIELGKVKKKPSDFFRGEINYQGKVICKIEGTYLGFIDIDGVRYWDYRMVTPFRIYMKESCLESDHMKRLDLITLKSGDVKKAQQYKEQMEESQRSDRKLREDYEKKMNKKK